MATSQCRALSFSLLNWAWQPFKMAHIDRPLPFEDSELRIYPGSVLHSAPILAGAAPVYSGLVRDPATTTPTKLSLRLHGLSQALKNVPEVTCCMALTSPPEFYLSQDERFEIAYTGSRSIAVLLCAQRHVATTRYP
jgi:hypothetical protein